MICGLIPRMREIENRKTKSSNLFHRTVITGDILRSFGIYAMEYYKFNSFPGPCSSPPVVHESSLSIRRNNTKFPRSLLPRYYIIIIIIVLPRGSVLGCRPPHILIPPCSNGESYPNDATTERSNAVDINAFFTRILNSLSLSLSHFLYMPLSLYRFQSSLSIEYILARKEAYLDVYLHSLP